MTSNQANPQSRTTPSRGNGNSNNPARAQTEAQPQAPSRTANYLKVLTVEEYESPDGKAARRWTQVGVAFPHKEGEGFNIELRCLPLNGRLVILPPDADQADSR